ncbi:MAG: precorrin-6y C5,15-methyltransferase (decarboxylating) subunit CbiE [Leptolyngbya sp. SIO4C1]|nr:precorrin-6y C5,15-methyltransferase (decarboxylating) subunit CbiE [Leptolyngbya sp. SIO4C1]
MAAAESLIHVVGLGLDGASGLSLGVQQQIERADILVGSARHLAYFPDHPAQRRELSDLQADLRQLQTWLAQPDCPQIVILTSGDPLFFGLGRLLLSALPAEQLTFHPQISSVQLAFSRLKLPWQDASWISVHGRAWEPLIAALTRGEAKLAVLSDPLHSPSAIAGLMRDLGLPYDYQIWVCENLGGAAEQVRCFTAETLTPEVVAAPLTVVVLLRQLPQADPQPLPLLGISDRAFCRFADRPGLMTKREVRVLALSELALAPAQVIWDIGAGTGSVSVEVARLSPTSEIYAVEKTAAGCQLIEQNARRFQLTNLHPIAGSAPEAVATLPAPNRVFIGGSGGQLPSILSQVAQRLLPTGRVVAAIATVDSLAQLTGWLAEQPHWRSQLLQINLARSAAVGAQTRLVPLNPVTLATLTPR